MYLISCLFSFVSFGLLVTPGVPVCVRPVLPCLDLLKTVNLSLLLVSCSSFLPDVCTVTDIFTVENLQNIFMEHDLYLIS